MAGIANLLWALSGQPDPSRQLAALLAGQQPQGAGGPGAGGPGAGGPGAAPPGSPPSPGGAAPTDASAAPGSGPVPAPGAAPPPGSPPVPQSLQSPPDMSAAYQTLANPPNIMSLYLQMQQRDQAMAGFNSGLALIAANHSPPSMRQAIMESANAGQEDAGQTVGNLMSLHSAMTQQGALQDMLTHASDYDTKLGLPPGTSRDMILAGKGPDLISKMEPTDTQRNIQFQHDAFIKGGGSEEDWQKNYLPMIITGGIPGMTPDMKSMNVARTQWLADPANAGKPTPGYLTDVGKWGFYSKNLDTARGSFNGMNQALGEFIDHAGDIAADPELAAITGSPGNKFKAEHALSGTAANDLVAKMKQLGADAKAMSSRGGPKGVDQNLATLGANPEGFTDFSVSHYGEDQIAPKVRTALVAQANAYGAAGRLSEMPHYLDQYLDPMYQRGGDLDPGGPTKAFTLSKDPNLKQPTPADIDTFKHNLEHFGPKRALAQLKADGIDTSSLE